jgi:cytochrome c-type biogenesis protein CcmH/NrfG
MGKSPFYVKHKPLTRADELRERLDELEARAGRLGYGLGQDALRIPVLLDSITQDLTSFQEQGHVLRAEEARLQAVSASLRRKAGVFLREIGGAAALVNARRARRPDPEQWWWFLDEFVAERRRGRLRHAALVAGGVVVVLLMLFAAYQRFLAPDPATRERVRRQYAAENLALEGDMAAALGEVEQGLAAAPNDPYLLVLKGSLQRKLGRNAAAEESFEAARTILGDQETFLLARGQALLLVNEPGAALADAQAAVEINPELATGYMLLGRVYEQTGQYPDAILAYQQASKLADEQGDYQLAAAARVNMAMLMQRQ